MMTAGPIRREKMVEKIADEFTLTHQLDKRARAALLGAVRIGVIEAARGCMFATALSPSVRQAIEAWWGLEGAEKLANAPFERN